MSNPWARWLAANGTTPFQLNRKEGWHAFVNAGPRPDFEVLTRTEMDALSPQCREDYDEARMVWNANLPTVKTHQLVRAYEVIDQVMASSRRDGDRLRGAVVIDASPALGKTTIALRYGRDFHRQVIRRYGPLTGEGHQRWPVAFIDCSADMTLKGLNEKILAWYDHVLARRGGTSYRLASRAVDCVNSCETRMIIIDDLHFVDFNHRNGVQVSNHLKSLANEMPVTFVFVGVQLSAKRFFDEGMLGEQASYAQTSRRATRCAVAPFSLDSPEGARSWTSLLAALETHIKLADAGPGMLTDHAKLLHRRTQGRIGSLTGLLDRACLQAIRAGVERITAELIANTTVDNAAENSTRAG